MLFQLFALDTLLDETAFFVLDIGQILHHDAFQVSLLGHFEKVLLRISLFEFLNLHDLITDEINETNIQVFDAVFCFQLALLVLQILLNVSIALEKSVVDIYHNIQIFRL